MKLNKSQKQMIMLGVVMASIVAVLGFFVFAPQNFSEIPFESKTVDTVIPRTILEHPEYRQLRLPVELPLVPGRLGRDNPFEPY